MLNGLYKHDAASFRWIKEPYRIIPASADKLRLYDTLTGNTLLTLVVNPQNNSIQAKDANDTDIPGVTVTYGKLMTPTIANGTVGSCTDMLPRETCTGAQLLCSAGFVPQGSFEHNGTSFITHTGACVLPQPDGRCSFDGATVIGAGAAFTEGSACKTGSLARDGTCAFTCNPGYYLAGAVGAVGATGSLTCKTSVATANGTCRPYDSGIFVTATGPEGGHYILDGATWYKDGDKSSHSIVANGAALQLRNPDQTARYNMTVVAGLAGPTGLAALVVKDVQGNATVVTAEFVCGPPGATTCTGFSKETATSFNRTGASTGATGSRSIATLNETGPVPKTLKVVLYRQSDASWAGTSIDGRFVHVLGTKVTILSKPTAAGIVTAVYEASGTGLTYVLTPTAATALAALVPMIAVFDVSPIGPIGPIGPLGPIGPIGTLGPTTAPEPWSPSGGEIAGILAGSVGFILLVVFFVVLMRKRGRKAPSL